MVDLNFMCSVGKTNISEPDITFQMEKAMRVIHVDNSFAVSGCGHVVVSEWGMCNMLVVDLRSPLIGRS